MKFFKGTKTQISPCILSKARYALRLKEGRPINTKTCSYTYWCKVLETLTNQNNLSVKTLKEAKQLFNVLIK